MKNSHLFDNILEEGKLNKNVKLNEGLFGTSNLTLREFFNIETFYCSSKTRFCIFDGDKDKPDATLVVYGDDIIEGEEEVQPYLDKRIEYINFDAHRVNICLITQMKEASSLKENYDEQLEEVDYGFHWEGEYIYDKDGNWWYFGDYINGNTGIEPYSSYIQAVRDTADGVRDRFWEDEIADPEDYAYQLVDFAVATMEDPSKFIKE